MHSSETVSYTHLDVYKRQGSDSALSQLGSSGSEVRAIQERLKERGLFNDSVTGYYGEKTKAAVI